MTVEQSGRKRIQINQVLSITIGWTVVGLLDAVNTQILSDSLFLQATDFYQFGLFYWLNILSALFAGLLSGFFLIFFLREKMRRRPFWLALSVNTSIITFINLFILVLVYRGLLSIYSHAGQLSASALDAGQALEQRAFFIRHVLLWAVVVFFTIVTLHVNEKYGQGVLLKILFGHYHRPREEERIFMFADIKSSTMIAEKLGHVRFYNYLNDFFSDVTNPVVNTKGEIYQYVGDEVVISWTMKKGLQNANCLQCFFQLLEAVRKAQKRYIDRYGVGLEFKVGLHAGMVTTGEIGVIKKDIVFSGDVMNTTARIQAVCNKFRVNILISKYLLDLLNLPPDSKQVTRVGVIELKGKKQKVELYTFEDHLPKHKELLDLAIT